MGMILLLVFLVAGFFTYRSFTSSTAQGVWKKVKENASGGAENAESFELQVKRCYYYPIGSYFHFLVEWIVKNTGTTPRNFIWQDKCLQINFDPRKVVPGNVAYICYKPSNGDNSEKLMPGEISKPIQNVYIVKNDKIPADFVDKLYWGIVDSSKERLKFRIHLEPENKASEAPQFISPNLE